MNSRLAPAAVALFASVTLAGCGACVSLVTDQISKKSDDTVTEEGVDMSKNPLGALKALGSLGAEVEKLQKELAETPDVETLSFRELIEALPDPPAGWEATEPHGETNQMGDFKVSSARRTYTDGDRRVDVKIDDWAFHRALYMPFILSAKFSQESTDGYSKGITLGEDTPGREEYNTRRQAGKRNALLYKRYHIEIDMRNLPAEDFNDWWAAVKKDLLPRE